MVGETGMTEEPNSTSQRPVRAVPQRRTLSSGFADLRSAEFLKGRGHVPQNVR